MKLNLQAKYYINGSILLFLGIFSVTFLPLILKSKFNLVFANYIYFQIEFFLLCAGAIFYLFSPKYYKEQILSVILGGMLYYLFVKYYPLFSHLF